MLIQACQLGGFVSIHFKVGVVLIKELSNVYQHHYHTYCHLTLGLAVVADSHTQL